jgi:RNA polymerase sigma-70 factor (ECF subfamily)
MKEDSSNRSKWLIEEVIPHEGDLRGWLCSRFSSVQDVDDVIQDAYARLLSAKESGAIVNPRAYLFICARNIALNRIRHLRYEKPPGTRDFDSTAIQDDLKIPSESAVLSDDVEILIKAIQSLPARCRQIITLRRLYGYSQKEVARKLGISEGTVEKQGKIGLKKCVKFFRSHGYKNFR